VHTRDAEAAAIKDSRAAHSGDDVPSPEESSHSSGLSDSESGSESGSSSPSGARGRGSEGSEYSGRSHGTGTAIGAVLEGAIPAVASHQIDELSGSFETESAQLPLDPPEGNLSGLHGGSRAGRASNENHAAHRPQSNIPEGRQQLGPIRTGFKPGQRDVEDGVHLSGGALLEPGEIQTGFEPVRSEASWSGTPVNRQARSSATSSSQISRYFAMQAANAASPSGALCQQSPARLRVWLV
jgi:hypothetical protein